MLKHKYLFSLFSFVVMMALSIPAQMAFAQPYSKEVLQANRDRLYKNITTRGINNKLSLSLSAETESDWAAAFGSMTFLQYHTPFTDAAVASAVERFSANNVELDKALVTYLYSMHINQYKETLGEKLEGIKDDYLYTLLADYLLAAETGTYKLNELRKDIRTRYATRTANILQQAQIENLGRKDVAQEIAPFFAKEYLPGKVLLISVQRKNRDWPGLVMVRDSSGNFLKINDSTYFSQPQLARSVSDLPYYFFNGNTPQGILRMDGFDTSRGAFIGPTTNVQFTLPFEYKAGHFFKDSLLADTGWSVSRYKDLLPKKLRNEPKLLEAWTAGKLGRSEIIAHGSTVDPNYYKDAKYFPLTPSQGCLSSKEIWNTSTGILMESDQLTLTRMISRAGGPQGYCIVVELNDEQKPVSIDEIISFLQ